MMSLMGRKREVCGPAAVFDKHVRHPNSHCLPELPRPPGQGIVLRLLREPTKLLREDAGGKARAGHRQEHRDRMDERVQRAGSGDEERHCPESHRADKMRNGAVLRDLFAHGPFLRRTWG